MVQFELDKAILISGKKKKFVAIEAGIGPGRLSRIIHGDAVARESEKLALARVLRKDVKELFPEGQ
jgi:hypothetical protein